MGIIEFLLLNWIYTSWIILCVFPEDDIHCVELVWGPWSPWYLDTCLVKRYELQIHVLLRVLSRTLLLCTKSQIMSDFRAVTYCQPQQHMEFFLEPLNPIFQLCPEEITSVRHRSSEMMILIKGIDEGFTLCINFNHFFLAVLVPPLAEACCWVAMMINYILVAFFFGNSFTFTFLRVLVWCAVHYRQPVTVAHTAVTVDINQTFDVQLNPEQVLPPPGVRWYSANFVQMIVVPLFYLGVKSTPDSLRMRAAVGDRYHRCKSIRRRLFCVFSKSYQKYEPFMMLFMR